MKSNVGSPPSCYMHNLVDAVLDGYEHKCMSANMQSTGRYQYLAKQHLHAVKTIVQK